MFLFNSNEPIAAVIGNYLWWMPAAQSLSYFSADFELRMEERFVFGPICYWHWSDTNALTYCIAHTVLARSMLATFSSNILLDLSKLAATLNCEYDSLSKYRFALHFKLFSLFLCFLSRVDGAMEFFFVAERVFTLQHHKHYFSLAWCTWKGLALNAQHWM